MSKVIHNVQTIERLSPIRRIIASSGGISSCIDMMMIQTFLLYYYTDVLKINAAFSGGLLLVARIAAAFAVPVFGIFIDRKTTPWGKYKPYYLMIGIPAAIFGFLTFTSFNLDQQGKYIYASITYFIYNLLISLGGIPKGAMGPSMTKSMEDRISMGFLGYIFSVIGSLLVVSAGPVLIKVFGNGREVKGFSLTMALFCFINILIAIIQWMFLEEKYIIQESKQGKYQFQKLLSVVFHNKTSIIVLLITFSINLANGIRMAVTIHYLKYYFQRPELMAQFGLISMLSLFGGAFLSSKITKYLGIKKVLIISFLINILSFGLIYPLGANKSGVFLYLILSMINNFFNGLSTPAQSTLMPNVIDYCEWKTGMSAGAFMSALSSFVSTSATAFAGIFVGLVLSMTGYQPDIEQSHEALVGIRVMMSIAPAVACMLSLIVIGLKDTEKEHERIVQELMTKRNYI